MAKADRDAATAKLTKAKTMGEVRVRQAQLAVATANAEHTSLTARAEQADKDAAAAESDVRRVKLELSRARGARAV